MDARTVTARRRTFVGSLLERTAWRVGLAAAERIRVGRLTVVLAGRVARTCTAIPASDMTAEIRIHDREALVRMLVGGETGGGEAYMDGLWSSPDLARLLRLAALEPRGARAVRLAGSALPAQLAADARPPSATQHEGEMHDATSPPTTTWATTSTGSSSTRR